MTEEELFQLQLAELLEFLRFRSVSTDPNAAPHLHHCASWLQKKFRRLGLECETIPTTGHPAVLARTPPRPGKPSVLFYGHYDVQPEDPAHLWLTPPFDPVIRNDKILARGASDNKGQIFAHIAGLERLLLTTPLENLPANVIFLIEGEEEIGSPHLPPLLEQYKPWLRCDAVVISDSSMAAHHTPTLAYSLRGVAAMEVLVTGPAQDLHSGVYGGTILNPCSAAARLIASLHDDHGRIAIPGFYDHVLPLQDWERQEAARLPLTEQALLTLTGAPALHGEPGYSPAERIGARPTAEVNGIGGGYQGPGSKTVIPSRAFFKLTFRTVPNQSSRHILDLAEQHLRRHCPPAVRLDITRGHSGEPFYLNPHSPKCQAASRALARVFGKKPCLLREGGSIPILNEFQSKLGTECLLLALGAPDCNSHAPNECFPLENFRKGIALHAAILEELAALPLPNCDYTRQPTLPC